MDIGKENTNTKKPDNKEFKGRGERRPYFAEKNLLEKEIVETKRVVKVTKGGRRFSFSSLVLFRDPKKHSIAFIYSKAKEIPLVLKKALIRAKKKLITYFSQPVRTISSEIFVKYKATQIFIKPTSKGNGIRAGGVLNTFFKYLEIKDISAKIIGSRNKLNVIRAAFIALDKLTEKKYVS